ncbi:Mitochondrial inner membrane protease subunit 1 [Linum grandiflorum]
MVPTINLTGDLFLAERISPRIGKVPRGHVWIQGDNIYNSKDSRNFGPVPYALVEAKLFWRVWPPKDFGKIGERK